MANKKMHVNDQFEIAVQKVFNDLQSNDEQFGYEFPSSLFSHERKYIHELAVKYGFKTKSRGSGSNRYIGVFKQEACSQLQSPCNISMSLKSFDKIKIFLQKNPLTAKERRELESIDKNASNKRDFCVGRLSNVQPGIPTKFRVPPEVIQFRKSLPIWNHRKEIAHLVEQNSVVLITGDTGCGKTTQVPQFILDYHNHIQRPCRIIAAEPRRLAALTIAARIAEERGCRIGTQVGFQIRLESVVSPNTLLTFCTNGVLLRTLMGGSESLKYVTHIILDEIHERDRFSDFLLLILKSQVLKHYPIKLILMSATMDTQKFINYFDGCPVIEVPKQTYHVQPYFLEDILKMTKFLTPARAAQILSSKEADKTNSNFTYESSLSQTHAEENLCNPQSSVQTSSYSTEIQSTMNMLINIAWNKGNEEHFQELLSLMINDRYPVDFQNTQTGITTLMAAAARGKKVFVETLLGLNADANLKTFKEPRVDALTLAGKHGHDEIYKLLKTYLSYKRIVDSHSSQEPPSFPQITEQDKLLSNAYSSLYSHLDVNHKLIVELIGHIVTTEPDAHKNTRKGAILVFLPGYDEIVTLRDMIRAQPRLQRFMLNVFTLHSQMRNQDQVKIFNPLHPGHRKIILATNIAETSITIDDVVYVIDSGKVKEISYDHNLGLSMLKRTWISRANAIQRRGRAGRCQNGVCYHLFSKSQFVNMPSHQVPEILRMPIHELCLQTKLLIPDDLSIIDFITQLLDPPPLSTLRSSIELLKAIEALNEKEELTEIGCHLLDFPLEPALGKMILNAVALKCLDPVLTIVCALNYRDPFVLPSDPSLNAKADWARHSLCNGSMSDHLVLLRAFQAWQKAERNRCEETFFREYFIHPATMETIFGIRAQLLGLLRASGFVRSRPPGDIRDLNKYSDNWTIVKAALCAGSYPNILRADERGKLMTSKTSSVRFHPSSALIDRSDKRTGKKSLKQSKMPPSSHHEWFIFESLVRVGRISYARCCTVLSPLTVALFAGPSRLPSDALKIRPTVGSYDDPSDLSDEESHQSRAEAASEVAEIAIDDWLKFELDKDLAKTLMELRQKWSALFLRRVKNPEKLYLQSEDFLIKTITDILNNDEVSLGLNIPSGVGQRPKPIPYFFD